MIHVHACIYFAPFSLSCVYLHQNAHANNLIKTSKRNSLSIETENKYLYIYFNMPCLQNWDPRSAIKAWLNEKIRRDRSNIIEKKATQQPHFKGIFENVIDENDSNEQKLTNFTRKF